MTPARMFRAPSLTSTTNTASSPAEAFAQESSDQLGSQAGRMRPLTLVHAHAMNAAAVRTVLAISGVLTEKLAPPNGPKLTGLDPHARSIALGAQSAAGLGPVQRRVSRHRRYDGCDRWDGFDCLLARNQTSNGTAESESQVASAPMTTKRLDEML
jgi:hypothetical protein